MNENGKHRDVAVIDEPGRTTGSFYDFSNPVLKPPQEIDARKQKSWKRRLVGWCLLLLFIGGSVLAGYLLLRINHVNVRVDADARRAAINNKPKADSGNSENGLTTEAINIAREAAGNDTARSGNSQATSSPSPSPNLSASPGTTLRADYSYSGNSSPAWEQLNDNVYKDANQQQSSSGNNPNKPVDSQSAPVLQNHANSTVSIVVDETPPKPAPTAQVLPQAQSRSQIAVTTTKPSVVLPPFGTMLPVRTQGVIFTLRNNSYARLELARDVSGPGWSLPQGTVFVGRTSGSEYDRAFVSVIGYIDPRENKLVKLSGEVLGSDGATGISGKRIGIDRHRMKQTMRKVAASGVQVAGMMAGALGRGPIVIDGAGYRLVNPLTTEAGGAVGDNTWNTFVKVEAGRSGYVMVADLPKAIQGIDAPGSDESVGVTSLSDRDVMELILFGTTEEVRAALPLMSEEQRNLALKSIGKDTQPK